MITGDEERATGNEGVSKIGDVILAKGQQADARSEEEISRAYRAFLPGASTCSADTRPLSTPGDKGRFFVSVVRRA